VTVVRVKLEDFPGRLKADMKAREKRVRHALETTALRGAAYVKTRVPYAFGELRESVRAQGTQIVADAPHAAPVETGSRPHWMPVRALFKWVALKFSHLSPADQRRVAYAIQHKIAERGTKPRWYMRGSLPQIQKILDREIKRALPD
jgi:hypothetical protein